MKNNLAKIFVKLPETADLTEKQLITSRRGKELTEDLMICVKNYFNFGIYWILLKVCLHPHQSLTQMSKDLEAQVAKLAS